MRKSLIFLSFFVLSATFLQAQKLFRIGARVGASTATSQFSEINFNDPSGSFKLKEGNAKIGFHAGLMAQINLPILPMIIMPEFLFSSTGSEVEITDELNVTKKTEINISKLDIPIMFGLRAGPARLYVGPIASIKLSQNSELSDKIGDAFDKDTYKNATFGFQAGIGVNVAKKLALDLKYEGGLSDWGDSITIYGEEQAFDSRTKQILLSVGYLF